MALCPADGAAADVVVLRAITAHAALALNENNRSLHLFLCLSNRAARQVWANWTETFAKDNPTNQVALYLRGDALARLSQWEQAVEFYSRALTCKPSLALAHNALGLAHTRLGKPELALTNFEQACKSAPSFADAHASLGAFWLMREAPEGALAAFKSALVHSTNFALALNGRACATFGFSQDAQSLESALADLAAASRWPAVRPLAETNTQNILLYAQERGKGQMLISTQGMTLNTREMLHRDQSITGNQMGRMSTADLLGAYNQFGKNAQHSERWGGIVDKASGSALGFGLDMKQWSQSSFKDAQGWRGLESQAFAELKQRGIDPTQGGARFRDLENAYTDRGNWPVTTLFGLAQ
jgi:tetratricopeptide (TPR) repeat protein